MSITLTPTLSLNGEGVSCLVSESVSQIVERPWLAYPAGINWRKFRIN